MDLLPWIGLLIGVAILAALYVWLSHSEASNRRARRQEKLQSTEIEQLDDAGALPFYTYLQGVGMDMPDSSNWHICPRCGHQKNRPMSTDMSNTEYECNSYQFRWRFLSPRGLGLTLYWFIKYGNQIKMQNEQLLRRNR